ncbi:MAG TPA: DUF1153 domain-containing protein [Paracoccus sp. (in: a-proteobacteria)]|nr:DUF1153 domain-containing protein [Paracoccus sp. (in: a-proteobacteria)]
MFVRKAAGPRAVTLADGTVLSLADLPDPQTRWVARRKAVVVRAVQHGLLAREEALRRYGLSEEELDSWTRAIGRHGTAGLKVKALRK